ncbi:unnamed protein product [Adineta steineri]|uniref:Hydrophobin n=2 Tax=Adineta steineri TaxID=433720 RepID=A0A819J9Z2_9BILA|nr:unnamed protein product [Adineta steineri]CAF3930335.1 unnamed protein product [Adineta steineri]
MQISKYLCVMIIGAIVIATSASPLRKRRNSGGSSSGCSEENGNKNGNGNSQSGQHNGNGHVNQQPSNVNYQNTQTNKQYTSNQCTQGSIQCCNNAASSNTAQSPSGKNRSGSLFYNKNQQLACDNYGDSNSGDQETGCYGQTYCCQGNSGNSAVDAQCSSIDASSITDLLSSIVGALTQ